MNSYTESLEDEFISKRIQQRLAEQDRKALAEHWKLIKAWMFELEWAGSQTLHVTRSAIVAHVEKKLKRGKE